MIFFSNSSLTLVLENFDKETQILFSQLREIHQKEEEKLKLKRPSSKTDLDNLFIVQEYSKMQHDLYQKQNYQMLNLRKKREAEKQEIINNQTKFLVNLDRFSSSTKMTQINGSLPRVPLLSKYFPNLSKKKKRKSANSSSNLSNSKQSIKNSANDKTTLNFSSIPWKNITNQKKQNTLNCKTNKRNENFNLNRNFSENKQIIKKGDPNIKKVEEKREQKDDIKTIPELESNINNNDMCNNENEKTINKDESAYLQVGVFDDNKNFIIINSGEECNSDEDVIPEKYKKPYINNENERVLCEFPFTQKNINENRIFDDFGGTHDLNIKCKFHFWSENEIEAFSESYFTSQEENQPIVSNEINIVIEDLVLFEIPETFEEEEEEIINENSSSNRVDASVQFTSELYDDYSYSYYSD